MPSIEDIMKMAQEAQAKLQEAQVKLDQIEVEGMAGGGMVKIKATARGRVTGVVVDPSLLVPRRSDAAEARRLLEQARGRLAAVEPFETEALDAALHALAEEQGVRAGTLTDSSLYYRKLAELKRGTFASPGYLARFGTPRTLADLANGHTMMGLLAPDSPSIRPLAFTVAGKVQELMLPTVITVTGPDTNIGSACAGLGIIQVPRYGVVSQLANGTLVELLADYPPPLLPVHALYSHTRQLSPRLRVFIDWLAQQYRTRDAP